MHSATPVADVVVHLHPQTSCDDRNKIEQDLRARRGIVAVRFNEEEHPHALVVQYDANLTSSQEVLAEVRKCDSEATMAGL
jgi:cell division protein FtsX